MNPRPRFLIVVALVLAAVGVLAAADLMLLGVISSRPTTSGTAAIGGPFTLVASDGSAVSDQTYRGKWLLIFFGYTFCPDACPTALNSISVALDESALTQADCIRCSLQSMLNAIPPRSWTII